MKRKILIRVAIFIAIILSLIFALDLRFTPVAESRASPEFVIEGELNLTHVKLLAQHSDTLDKVVINSTGGSVEAGRKIGKLLFERNLPVEVRGVCGSSCAEYVLPGASYVIVRENSRIWFHGNSYMMREVARSKGFEENVDCIWPAIEWLDFIYERRRLSYKFVELQIETVGLPSADFVRAPNGCLLFTSYSHTKAIWEPSIETLKRVWGLDVRTARS